MGAFLGLLSLVALAGLVVGLIKPALAIRWGPDEKKTRRRVLLVYGVPLIVIPFLNPGFTRGFREGVREGLSEEASVRVGAQSPTVQAPETKKDASVDDTRIRSYCKGIAGDSFIVMETCVKEEEQARRRLEAISVDSQILGYCKGVAGDSYIVTETCIMEEQKAKRRLGM